MAHYGNGDNTVDAILDQTNLAAEDEYIKPKPELVKRKSTLVEKSLKIEYVYKKVEMPDDMVKLSLFLLVNQAYYKI